MAEQHYNPFRVATPSSPSPLADDAPRTSPRTSSSFSTAASHAESGLPLAGSPSRPASTAADRRWFYANLHFSPAGEQKGPISTRSLAFLFANGRVDEQTLVWAEGLAAWLPLLESVAFAQVRAGAQDQAARSPSVRGGVQSGGGSQSGGVDVPSRLDLSRSSSALSTCSAHGVEEVIRHYRSTSNLSTPKNASTEGGPHLGGGGGGGSGPDWDMWPRERTGEGGESKRAEAEEAEAAAYTMSPTMPVVPAHRPPVISGGFLGVSTAPVNRPPVTSGGVSGGVSGEVSGGARGRRGGGRCSISGCCSGMEKGGFCSRHQNAAGLRLAGTLVEIKR